MNSSGYIIATPEAIIASGATPEDAVAEARCDYDDDDERLLDTDALLRAPANHSGALYMRPATTRLLDQVAREGGAITWDDVDGVVDIKLDRMLERCEGSGPEDHACAAALRERGEIVLEVGEPGTDYTAVIRWRGALVVRDDGGATEVHDVENVDPDVLAELVVRASRD